MLDKDTRNAGQIAINKIAACPMEEIAAGCDAVMKINGHRLICCCRLYLSFLHKSYRIKLYYYICHQLLGSFYSLYSYNYIFAIKYRKERKLARNMVKKLCTIEYNIKCEKVAFF